MCIWPVFIITPYGALVNNGGRAVGCLCGQSLPELISYLFPLLQYQIMFNV